MTSPSDVETQGPAPDLSDWPDGAGTITVAKNLQHAVNNVNSLNDSTAEREPDHMNPLPDARSASG